MTESLSQGLSGTWAPAQCPFRVAYSLRALDDIRLAVVDAFFSIPHGGAEIGGILLGMREGLQMTILNYVPLDCEHAFGPSFTLSPTDLDRLSVLLEEARRNSPDLQPIGWYHSHTRSGIFLSEVDLEIHKRFFPAPWHIALVLKPHAFQPTRAGFFFREADGSFHAQASYLEFILESLPPRPGPAPTGPAPAPGSSVRLDSPPAPRVIPMPATAGTGSVPTPGFAGADAQKPELAPRPPAAQPPPPRPAAPAPAVQPPAPPAPPVQPPTSPAPAAQIQALSVPVSAPEHSSPAAQPTLHFPDLDPPHRWRVTLVLSLAAILVLGAFGFETRHAWLPHIWRHGVAAPARIPAVPSLGLTLTEHAGDLIIAWDHQAAAVQAATSGTLEISSGGGIPIATRLDATQLQSGSLAFKRETEKVDVILSVQGPHGELGRQSLGFLGKLPEQPAEEAGSAAARRRDALAVEVERLKDELEAQTARNQQLQKSLDQRAGAVAELDRMKGQFTAQVTRTKELEKAVKLKDDQLGKLRNDLSVQQSHNRVLAKSVDDLQLRLQQMKRLSNQNADPAKP